MRHSEGVTDYQRDLTAQYFLYRARNRRAYFNVIVNLYQALGRGWRKDQ